MVYKPIPLRFERLSAPEQERRLMEFSARMRTRRTVRAFSEEPVPRSLIEEAVRVAGSAPSGANLQPWHFVIIEDREAKRRIREAAEKEEEENYRRRFPPEWLELLSELGTDAVKPYLEHAPYLIAVFKLDYGLLRRADGSETKIKHYYVNESVGLAAGFLIAALHLAGLATLTHTPSPMGFLNEILGLPKNMKPVLLIPVGYPAPGATVPDLVKKPLEEISTWV
jgi:iodotyrosine deiodinase